MSNNNFARETITASERCLAGFILFYAGLVFCLPVPYTEDIGELYPWWAKRIDVGNVLLHELLFLGWIVIFGRSFILKCFVEGRIPTRRAAIWLIALALWCGLMSLNAPLVLQDLGRTGRLVVMAMLMLAVVRWTLLTRNFTLGMLILGLLIGTVLNLIISFQYPYIVHEVMRLSGQNTPGVAMGIAIHLSAWLFFSGISRKTQVLSLCSASVFTFGCAISYSRIGWIAGGTGLIAWAYILTIARPVDRYQQERLKTLRRVFVPVIIVGLVFGFVTSVVQGGIHWIQLLVEEKFYGDRVADMSRWSYLVGTIEILMQHPLGVGYSGFYDAMIVTDTYRFGSAVTETSPADADPHSCFLWYATAGGIPGGIMALIVFGLLLKSMWVGLKSALGQSGLVLHVLVAVPFLVIGLTVPYLFNSVIMITPTAIVAGWGLSRRLDLAGLSQMECENSLRYR